MYKVKRYKFPVNKDVYEELRRIERKQQELLQKKRQGYALDDEELDWLDWAESAIDAA